MIPQQQVRSGSVQAGVAGGPGDPLSADPQSAWAEYQPSEDRPWTLQLAGHLYRRAAFGANWDSLTRAVTEGPRRSVERLMRRKATWMLSNER